jgi:hypothetical protein
MAARRGYKLVYYKLRGPRLYEGIAEIELLEHSKIADQRQHEIYDTLRTNLARIVALKTATGTDISEGFLEKSSIDPFVAHGVKVGSILRVKHADLTDEKKCIQFYSTREGVMNISCHVPAGYTGSKVWYYPNGRLREKHYVINGIKLCVLGFYDNLFNTLKYNWTYELYPNEAFPIVREYLYNEQENPMAQHIIKEGRVISKMVYDRTYSTESLFLQSSRV